MTEIQEITVAIAPDGTVALEVNGVTGPACESLTAQLEQALGGVVLERRHKDCFRQGAAVEQTRRLSQAS